MSMLKLTIRKDVDLKLSLQIKEKKTAYKTKLPINEDTSFDIVYDVYESDNKHYLYIKMDENTATSPFFYNRSYELEELHQINRIFKTCETLNEVKEYMKCLFDENKIRLKYKDEEDIIALELDAILFITPIKIELDLYREMVPPAEKDNMLLCLYKINKQKLIALKDIYALILNNENDENCKELADSLKKYIIPGIEN